MDKPFDKSLHEQLKEFPCAFNLIDAQNVKLSQVKDICHTIESELGIGDDPEYEQIRKKNLLTWVLFCLGKVDDAVVLGEEINKQTKCRNISCLGNRVYVTQASGDVIEATRCMSILQALKLEDNFQPLLIEAKSEQAYYYSRIGGPQNLSRAINLFSEAVANFPQIYPWKFGLGLCCIQISNANIYCSSLERVDVEKCREEAVKLFLDVADNAHLHLQVMAYAKLTQIRQRIPQNCPHLNLFRRLSVDDLCKKALQRGGKNSPFVLTSCGRALKYTRVDRSIKLLEKSAAINESSATLHHLGKSYVIKAERMAKRCPCARRQQYNCPCCRPCKRQATPLTAEELQIGGKKQKMSSAEKKEFELPLSFRNLNIGEIPLPQNAGLSGSDSQDGANGIGPQHNKLNLDAWNPRKEVKKYLKRADKDSVSQLSMDDHFVQKAISSFKRAINICEDNLPAVFDLGMLLKRTGRTGEALKQFNKVAVNGFSFAEHILTIISAHRQAGLCYLQLGKKEEGNEMLLKAVSLEASLAVTMPELEQSCDDIWRTFIKLKNNVDQSPPSPDMEKQIIRLLKMVSDNRVLAKAIRELLQNHKPNELQYQEIVKAAVETFQSLGRPKDSPGVIQPGDSNSWLNTDAIKAMKTKVMLHAINRRLKEDKVNPIFLFQQLFELSYGACVGMDINEEGETARNTTMFGDVLVVFDKNQGSATCPSTTMKVASCFKEVAACLFGLEANENLKIVGVHGFGGDTMPNQMSKYLTVVVVVGDEQRSDMFKGILQLIPVNKPGTEAPSYKILVLNTGKGKVPQCLKGYPCLRMQDIGGFRDIAKDRRTGDGAVPYTEIVKQVFNGHIDGILKLFSFLTGGSWPLR